MGRLRRIISLVSVIAAGIGLTSAPGYNAYASKDSWQKDYLEVIANYSPESYPDATFELFYINEDDIPELYVETGDFAEGVKLYTYYDNQPVLCLEASYRCTLWLHSSKNGYFSEAYGVSAGYETFYNIIKLENGICNRIYEFYHDGRIMADSTHDIYTINGEEVSQEEFESREAEMNAEYSLISDYIDRDPVNKYSYYDMYKYLSGEIVSVETTEPSSTSAPNETDSSVIDSSDNHNDILSNTTITTTTENIRTTSNAVTSTSANNVKNNDSPKTGDKGAFGIAAIGLAVIGASLLFKKHKV
ncbi:MAG: LPXTG cell wall anchor domain-containing protein [Ruminococcus flavefaciens]|nr:LPXTG cell wall anchor domain-containing protein [Ruminococcus flavefaciens]MCM1061371.1 LPXTG cell wall anchor domain-containing protein [Eubacterium sp.]